ncbi:MAG: histidine--tRNA ligase [Clostridiales bacterium]|nr:histidine--tRNA ligase [Clostridiales bacterium]
MDFIKTPVKGMPEQLPNDMAIREYALRKIKDNYKKFGFMLISTPLIEHIENLTNKQGGENEQLIFKIMKRGEKLTKSESLEDLCDCGLRYDLTVPLARFYANNGENLPLPFKALQIGESFRADRPQKGRFRQFTQCDIDILGDSSNLAEIELISATANMLNELGIKELKVRVNDRNILRAMALSCGFPEEHLDTIYIILDKMDKIGLDGVKNSLLQFGLDPAGVEKYCNMFAGINDNIDCKQFIGDKLQGYLSDEAIENLQEIISVTSNIASKDCQIVFDPTLVRGMSYYTGPIFEIELKNYHASVAGGGRYDKMIGKYCSKEVCACGFSIGFERIISVIKENQLLPVEQDEKIAVLIAKDVDKQKVQKTIEKAAELRKQGKTIMICPRNSNAKFQKEKLSAYGFNNFVEIFSDKGEL